MNANINDICIVSLTDIIYTKLMEVLLLL